MAAPNRYSTFSSGSGLPPRTSTMQLNVSQQMSTTSCLNACHSAYTSAQPYVLESSTSLVVNTWDSAAHPRPDGRPGGIVDPELAQKAWEHARRRAEDGCVVLGYGIDSLSSPLAFLRFLLRRPLQRGGGRRRR